MELKIKNVDFSYRHYKQTLTEYLNSGYEFATISNAGKFINGKRIMLLRHDVDKSVKKALDLAKIENELGIRATYYVRLHSNYYNPFGYSVRKQIGEIFELGHEVGLHTEFFDFSEITREDPVSVFKKELDVFEIIFGKKAASYSLHRTTGSSEIDEIKRAAEEIKKRFNIVGSYDDEIMNNYKYLSDSSGIWREGCFSEHVGKHERIQVLIHAEWWFDKNINLEESLV